MATPPLELQITRLLRPPSGSRNDVELEECFEAEENPPPRIRGSAGFAFSEVVGVEAQKIVVDESAAFEAISRCC